MWRRYDFAMAGCIVTIAQNGSLQVIAALVKPEDMPKPTKTGEFGSEAGNGHDPDAATHGTHVDGPFVTTPMAPPKDREAEARKEAGVGIGLADDLRHTFASRALALGESLTMIGKLLGHSDIETTARYAHLAHDSIHETAERIADSIAADILYGRRSVCRILAGSTTYGTLVPRNAITH